MPQKFLHFYIFVDSVYFLYENAYMYRCLRLMIDVPQFDKKHRGLTQVKLRLNHPKIGNGNEKIMNYS